MAHDASWEQNPTLELGDSDDFEVPGTSESDDAEVQLHLNFDNFLNDESSIFVVLNKQFTKSNPGRMKTSGTNGCALDC